MIIGYLIMNWQMGILPKFVLLLVTSFIGIMAVYDLAIRRWNHIRFLFEMKARKLEG